MTAERPIEDEGSLNLSSDWILYADALEAELVVVRERAERLEQAIGEAEYALHPNQGEPPDPVRASQWLRTTFPPDHPNYVDPAVLVEQEKPKCENCKGGGCLDENGNPTVWGRADSYECQECGGTGLVEQENQQP